MRKSGSQRPATTVDEYLARVPSDKRVALEKLRKDIHAAAPGVEECISYQMPGFRYHGRVVVWLGAAAKHCAFYPGGLVREFARELADYDVSKGTIRFDATTPLPSALIKKIVKARIARAGKVSSSRKAR
jgi:uncharacterized protein YdhG (YjbR/CyaY superfamily)